MNDLNLGIAGGSTPTVGSIFTPPETETGATKGAEVVNGQIKDSTSTASTPGSLQVKGLVINLPNSPKLPPPNEKLVNDKLSMQDITSNPWSVASGKATQTFLASEAGALFTEADKKLLTDYQANPKLAVPGFIKEAASQIMQNTMVLLNALLNTGTTPTLGSGPTTVNTPPLTSANPSAQGTTSPLMKAADLSNAYDTEFLALLQKQMPPLAESQVSMLTSLHFNPGAKFAGSTNSRLLGKLENIEQKAAANTAKNLGIPLNPDGTSSVAMSANSTAYNTKLNDEYQKNFDAATAAFLVSNGAKQWTDDDKGWLKELQTDPKTDAPVYVKTAAKEILSTALNQLIANNNLQATGFVPPALAPVAPINVAFQNYLNTTNAVLGQAKLVVSQIADEGLKSQYMAILELISKALKDFQVNSHTAGQMSDKNKQEAIMAKLDAALAKIKESGKAALDAKNQAAKYENMGPIGKLILLIVTIILAIVAVLLTVFTLGLGAPVAALLFVVIGGGIIGMSVVSDKAAKEGKELERERGIIDGAVDDANSGEISGAVRQGLKSDEADANIKETLAYLEELQSAADDVTNGVKSSFDSNVAAAPSSKMSDNLIQIHLAIMKANKESESTLSEDNMLILKKLLEQLLALLAGGGDVSAFMGDMKSPPSA